MSHILNQSSHLIPTRSPIIIRYGGGRSGLSDTMAGALWCADALFAFAKAGASGFHFHWGFGGQPLVGGQPNTGVQTNFFNITDRVPSGEVGGPYPSVHAPWYSYLLFREATAGPGNGFSDTRFTKVNTWAGECKANIKVWSLLTDAGNLRVAVLNKDADTPCNVVVNLPDKFCSGPADLRRMMPGFWNMDSRAGVTWAGQTYDNSPSGMKQGTRVVEQVYPVKENGKCTVGIAMPVASGAVLEMFLAGSNARNLFTAGGSPVASGAQSRASGNPFNALFGR
jgi:hypothetical protein